MQGFRIFAVIITKTLLTGCSSDDESGIEPEDVMDQGEYSEKYNLTLFDQPPYVFNMQSEKNELSSSLLNDLTPLTQPLYDLLVVPNDDEGRDIIKKLTDETDGIAVSIRNWSEYDAKKGYRITSRDISRAPSVCLCKLQNERYGAKGVRRSCDAYPHH